MSTVIDGDFDGRAIVWSEAASMRNGAVISRFDEGAAYGRRMIQMNGPAVNTDEGRQ